MDNTGHGVDGSGGAIHMMWNLVLMIYWMVGTLLTR